MKYHNYVAVVGRLNGDDEDRVEMYTQVTYTQAIHAFETQVRQDEDIPEADVVAGYTYTEVYVNHVLVSESPIELVDCDEV